VGDRARRRRGADRRRRPDGPRGGPGLRPEVRLRGLDPHPEGGGVSSHPAAGTPASSLQPARTSFGLIVIPTPETRKKRESKIEKKMPSIENHVFKCGFKTIDLLPTPPLIYVLSPNEMWETFLVTNFNSIPVQKYVHATKWLMLKNPKSNCHDFNMISTSYI